MDIWYCPEFPVELANAKDKLQIYPWMESLKKNIAEQGLINPLIILNHRDPKDFKSNWVKVGTNRLWAIKQLGWKTFPALVTGICECEPRIFVTFEEAKSYIKDGELEIVTEIWGTVLQIINPHKPETEIYPTR